MGHSGSRIRGNGNELVIRLIFKPSTGSWACAAKGNRMKRGENYDEVVGKRY